MDWLFSTDPHSALLVKASNCYGLASKMAKQIQDNLIQQMEEQSELCDVSLVIGGQTQKAHWCVLVSFPYFQSLYTSGMKEKESGIVTLDIGKPAALRSVVKYMYEGTIEITSENIKDLLEVSDYLQISSLTEHCCLYLKSGPVNADNCVDLCVLGGMYNLESVYDRGYKYLCSCLPEVMKKGAILSLSGESIQELVVNEKLRYVTIDEFFSLIVQWREKDPEVRADQFESLFCGLDLTRADSATFEKIDQHEHIKDSSICRAHCEEFRGQFASGEGSNDCDKTEVIIVAGGEVKPQWCTTPISTGECNAYIPTEKRWVSLPPLPMSVTCPLMASDGKTVIYVMDGSLRYANVHFVLRFNINERTWEERKVDSIADLDNITLQGICVAKPGTLYLVVSCADPCPKPQQHRKNQPPPPPPQPNACLVLQYNDEDNTFRKKCCLFLCSLSAQIRVFPIDERYFGIVVQKISDRPNASQRPRFFYYDSSIGKKFERSSGAVSTLPILYSHYGRVRALKMGKVEASTIDVLDPQGKWKHQKNLYLPLMPIHAERTNYSYQYLNGHLYIFGGKIPKDLMLLESVNVFDTEKREWSVIDDLPLSMMNPGTCVVKLPSEFVRCHLQCPHCEHIGRRNMVKYDKNYVEESSDDYDSEYCGDDPDYDYDDDSLYAPSDGWSDWCNGSEPEESLGF